ncbi:MAG TPA: hemolysin family protein [Acidobacteriaceae bacterium]|nr:hemolysin family protein [Acidobacteriaceae bacterium]
MPDLPLFRATAVAALILINAFFVAAEFALVSLRQTRVQQLARQGRPGARTLEKLQQNLDEFLPAVQLGVTLCSLALGWLGEPFVANLLHPFLDHLPHAGAYGRLLSVALAFLLITYFQVLLGELVPKSLALRNAERMALRIAGPMDVFMRLTGPLVRGLDASATSVLRLFGTAPVPESGVHSPEELKLIATATRRMGLLPEYQEAILHRVLDLDQVLVREIMTPRQQIFSLPSDMTVAAASTRILDMQYSRVPVYDAARGPENITGVVYAKDLSRLMHVQGAMRPSSALASTQLLENTLRLQQLMHDVLVVPETKPVSDLLIEFQKRRRHMAIVVDEFGTTTGLVTVEDTLEQIVGELEDEFDLRDTSILRLDSGVLLIEGSANLRDLEQQIHLVLPRDGGIETLAGFVLTCLQKIPQPGDTFLFGGRRFTVLTMDGRRIGRVRIEREPAAEQGTDSESGSHG